MIKKENERRVTLSDLKVDKVFDTVYASELAKNKFFWFQTTMSEARHVHHNNTEYYDFHCYNSKLPLMNKGMISASCSLRIPKKAFNYAVNDAEQLGNITDVWNTPATLKMKKLTKNTYCLERVYEDLSDKGEWL